MLLMLSNLATAGPVTLATYRPFIDPIDMHRLWFLLLVPLSLLISMAYKAVRTEDLKDYTRDVLIMTVQIIFGMIALGFCAYLFVEYVAPMIVPK